MKQDLVIGDFVFTRRGDGTVVRVTLPRGNDTDWEDRLDPPLLALLDAFNVQTRALAIVGAIIKELVRNEARIMAPNEYRRRLGSLCQKISATIGSEVRIEELNALLWPIYLDLVSEMGAIGSNTDGNHRRNRPRRG